GGRRAGGGGGKGAEGLSKHNPEVTPPPTKKPNPAGAITQTTATLNAMVNPNGNEVSSCTFEYGTTTAYGKTAPCTPAPGAGSSSVAVSAAISGLSANTTYHFRISATNGSGTATGRDGESTPKAGVIATPRARSRPAGQV